MEMSQPFIQGTSPRWSATPAQLCTLHLLPVLVLLHPVPAFFLMAPLSAKWTNQPTIDSLVWLYEKDHLSFFSNTIAFLLFQIAQNKAETPTITVFLSSLLNLLIHPLKQSLTFKGMVFKPHTHLTKLQSKEAAEQVNNRWSIDSSCPQNTHPFPPFHPFLSRTSLVKILFLFTNHRKTYFRRNFDFTYVFLWKFQP